MNKKLRVTVTRHRWLDLSLSWFVKINEVKSGGEINSEKEAINTAKALAKSIGGVYDKVLRESSELFSSF